MSRRRGLEWLAPYVDFKPHFATAKRCKELRATRVIKRHLSHGHGEPGRSRSKIEEDHRTGCAAEVAFRLWLGIDPNPDHESWNRGDVLGVGVSGIEVRGTFSKGGHLIVYAADASDQIAVLVLLCESGAAIIRGWIPIHEAQDARRFPSRTRLRGVEDFWVPCKALNPMRDLPIAVPLDMKHERGSK